MNTSFLHVVWAETGEQKYLREKSIAPRKADGSYDLRYRSGKFAKSFEEGCEDAVNYGVIRTT